MRHSSVGFRDLEDDGYDWTPVSTGVTAPFSSFRRKPESREGALSHGSVTHYERGGSAGRPPGLPRNQVSRRIRAGSSIRSITVLKNLAASAPSMTRWSNDRDRPRDFRTTTLFSLTAGISLALPTPRMATSGWLMMGVP